MSIQTYKIPKGAIRSVNVELGIPVGTEIDITNESVLYKVYLQESSTQPPLSLDNKRSLTQRDKAGSEAYIPPSSLEIWAYAPYGDVTLSVQVL